MTYFYQRFQYLPYVHLVGMPGSGKSRIANMIASMAYAGKLVDGTMTDAAMFRFTDQQDGTLVIDEADKSFSGASDQFAKLLNSGYKKGSHVMRVNGDDMAKIDAFHVFGPKVLASQNEYYDNAIESRCLSIVMQESNRTDIPTELDEKYEKRVENVRNTLTCLRHKMYFNIAIRSERVEGVSGRVSQIGNPLLSICLEEDKAIILDFLHDMQREMDDSKGVSDEGIIMGAVYRLYHQKFMSGNGFTRAFIKDILEEIEKFDPRYKFVPRRVGRVLRNHGLKPKRLGSMGYGISFIEYEGRLKKIFEKYKIDDDQIDEDDIRRVSFP